MRQDIISAIASRAIGLALGWAGGVAFIYTVAAVALWRFAHWKADLLLALAQVATGIAGFGAAAVAIVAAVDALAPRARLRVKRGLLSSFADASGSSTVGVNIENTSSLPAQNVLLRVFLDSRPRWWHIPRRFWHPYVWFLDKRGISVQKNLRFVLERDPSIPSSDEWEEQPGSGQYSTPVWRFPVPLDPGTSTQILLTVHKDTAASAIEALHARHRRRYGIVVLVQSSNGMEQRVWMDEIWEQIWFLAGRTSPNWVLGTLVLPLRGIRLGAAKTVTFARKAWLRLFGGNLTNRRRSPPPSHRSEPDNTGETAD
jgi:hypothetical protein